MRRGIPQACEDLDRDVYPDETTIVDVTASDITISVIKRDVHSITPAEAKLHADAVRDGKAGVVGEADEDLTARLRDEVLCPELVVICLCLGT